MDTLKLTQLAKDSQSITEICSKYSEEELQIISFIQSNKIDLTEKNYLIISKISEYGKSLLNKVNSQNFNKIVSLLGLDKMTIEEMLKDRMFDIPKNAYMYYDFTLGTYVKRCLYFLNELPNGTQEEYNFYNQYYYRLNNNNPYQGWTSSEGENVGIIKDIIFELKRMNIENNEDNYKRVGAVISLVNCNFYVSEENIQTIIAMGEYNGNYSIYIDIVSQYFPVMRDFKKYAKRDINKTDVKRVLREITRIYGFHSSYYDRRKFDFDKLNKTYCLLSTKEIEELNPINKSKTLIQKIVSKIFK